MIPIWALLVIGGSLAYYFRDEIFRLARLKTTAIIYYSEMDAYATYVLYKSLYPWVDVYRGSWGEPIPKDAQKYPYKVYIFIGGQAVNPMYAKFVQTGDLPEINTPGQTVIKRIGDYIFIAGYTDADTYQAVLQFLKKK